nr:MAG TPA: hypothetical protein [Bacteriophage sp.]
MHLDLNYIQVHNRKLTALVILPEKKKNKIA